MSQYTHHYKASKERQYKYSEPNVSLLQHLKENDPQFYQFLDENGYLFDDEEHEYKLNISEVCENFGILLAEYNPFIDGIILDDEWAIPESFLDQYKDVDVAFKPIFKTSGYKKFTLDINNFEWIKLPKKKNCYFHDMGEGQHPSSFQSDWFKRFPYHLIHSSRNLEEIKGFSQYYWWPHDWEKNLNLDQWDEQLSVLIINW
jgi:hypothetical protein